MFSGPNLTLHCRYFWITDSCPRTVKAVTDLAPFEVLSLAQPIAAALQI
jgi:hypothetical protein